ncbi:hydrogenase maturation nickel metallochaperone HypA [Desulfallas thermosapovorans]|uniref:Hydrogenase maturation factor HypA n=1 Tax=Desulfallas thermosapovorans DSM 6562 TaxID=1121431 RepID=A0A5S4ZR59_9FIRM|nr:hydrogenase maturation nickel metallochaperone HypA [Desulfallas thermosapovorans]TYO95402.1 hydrogenase nickel incorporation protein HypA/HybF [Desulfallas thermosapovorans DSM 6562]
MHELSLIHALIDTVVQSARENGITKVTKVKLVVGESHGALPDALQFAFDILTVDTVCAGAELAIEKNALLLKCRECAREFHPEGYLFCCPGCGVSNAALVKGNELYVEYFEGE